MPHHFADRLTDAVASKGTPICVGIDPTYERLPLDITQRSGFNDSSNVDCVVDALTEFCRAVIDIVAEIVPAVKINIAFFEQYYWDGIEAYFSIVEEARSRGLIVIGDIKRADVGHSAQRYAQSQLAMPSLDHAPDLMLPDAVTINPYLGIDAVDPFLQLAQSQGKGVFVLVRTSNPSARDIQNLTLEGGESVYQVVGRLVNQWAGSPGLIGQCGYSLLGAVASPTEPGAMARLRAEMPNCIFLVPGIGAQGLSAGDASVCFKADGTGALLTASRSVLYAFDEQTYAQRFGDDWKKCIEHACKDFANAARTVVTA